jgi:hypothetical protein
MHVAAAAAAAAIQVPKRTKQFAERKRERERERETDRERGRERSPIGPFHDRNMLPKPNFRNCSQDRGSKNNIFIRKHVVAAAKAKQSVS